PEPGESGQTSGEAARCERYRTVSQVAALLVLITGAAVLAGWALDSAPLKRVLPGYVAMVPLTALGFVLAGLSLLLLHPEHHGPVRRYVGAALAALLLLLGATSVFHYLTGEEPAVGGPLLPTAVRAHPGAPNAWPAPTCGGWALPSGAALLGRGGCGPPGL